MTVLSKNNNGRTLTVAVNKSTTVKEMKVKFMKKMFVRETESEFLRYMIVVEGLLHCFRFVSGGKELEDDTLTLGDCGIENESNIQITQRLRGGGKRDTTDTQSSAAKRAKIECKKKSAADKDKDAKKEDQSQRAMDQIKGWKEAAIAARAESIAQQQKSKKKIAALQKKIKDKDQKIKVKNKVIAEMDQKIKQMEMEIAEKDDEIAKKDDEIADLQQQVKPSASQEFESLLDDGEQELQDFQEAKDEDEGEDKDDGEDDDEDAEKVELKEGDRVTVHGSVFLAKTKQERNTNYFATIDKKEGDLYTLEFKYKDGKEEEVCKLELTDDLKMRKMSELELQAEKCAFDETPCTKCLQHGEKV